ncbi:hypothetical protein FPQ18DRAFT_374350 [Pyronema domesticum]|nr:hypothetical protein FPQ18DRAFT_374350 [Pyronema domesticum]
MAVCALMQTINTFSHSKLFQNATHQGVKVPHFALVFSISMRAAFVRAGGGSPGSPSPQRDSGRTKHHRPAPPDKNLVFADGRDWNLQAPSKLHLRSMSRKNTKLFWQMYVSAHLLAGLRWRKFEFSWALRKKVRETARSDTREGTLGDMADARKKRVKKDTEKKNRKGLSPMVHKPPSARLNFVPCRRLKKSRAPAFWLLHDFGVPASPFNLCHKTPRYPNKGTRMENHRGNKVILTTS